MARLNKFASVNLNESYGKPDRGGSANNNNSSSSSSSGKPRISSPGGMLVLSRPGRTQPPSPKPGQARLGIPSPVNLPSLKRESSTGDPLPASPPHTGWTKGESPPLSGWTKGESPVDSHLQQKVGLSRSLDTVGESLKTMATGKPDVYAPPALRAMQTGSTARPLPPTPPVEKPSAVIRGEEFPTLQAAVARPPTPPQHPRQRDLQQKQREKQQEAKEQQIKLQQLSQALQVQKESQGDSSQACSGNAHSQPSLSLRPLGKQEIVSQKVNVEASGLDPSSHSSSANNRFGMQGPNAYADGSLARSPPAGVPNQGSANKANNVFVDGSLSRSPPAGMHSQNIVNKADDVREAGHSFRPQYRSPLPLSQGSPSVDTRQSGFQTGSEPSWLSSSRRDFTPPSRNGDHTKLAPDMKTTTMEDMGQISSEPRSASFGRESYFSKDTSFFQEGSSGGIGREDAYVHSKGFGREIADSRFNSRSSALVHDGVPRIEGFYSQRSFGREPYNREPREVNSRMVREPGNRENMDVYQRDVRDSRENMDVYQRDIRDSRENFSRDTGDAYDRDVREAYNRDSRNVYSRDVREVYNQDVPMNKQVGYGYSSNNNGDNLWRGNSSYADSPYGRGSAHSPGIAPAYNPGPGHDTHYGRKYGPQGFGDQFSTRELRPSSDPRASRGMYESAAPYGSAEALGSRRVRSPAPSNSSFDPVKEVHEVRFEKPQRSIDEDRQIKFEDKGVDAKVTSNEPYGSSFSPQRPYLKRELSQGSATRIAQINTNKNLDDEKSSREDLKKQLILEDERRKEAAKLKLLELEERIARRSVEEGRKDEVGSESKDHGEAALKQQDVEQVLGNFRFESDGIGPVPERDIDVAWGEEDSSSKLARPSSASSASSWNYKSPGEGLVSQEQDFRLVSESELNQDRKVVRSRSPGSWRKEIGGGPTSKLFSSPYVESGGFRRPSDGGTYKLF